MTDATLGFDPEALRERYSQERARRLRADGMSQYVEVDGPFQRFADDPWADPHFTRAPLFDEVDVAIVGAGFGGLLTGARLRELGVQRLRLIDKAADVGGTWYWNRYPGIACDVESYVYIPLLEELGYVPSEKYAKGAEIFAHCQRIAEQYDLYRDACLQTEVHEIRWSSRRFPMDHLDQPRRRHPGAVRVDGQRLPAAAQAAGHTGHPDVRWPRVPHQPVGLRLHRSGPERAGRQAGRADRHRRDGRAVRSAPRRGGQASVGVPAHAVDRRRPRQPADRHRSGPRVWNRVGSAAASRTSRCSPREASATRTWSATPGRASPSCSIGQRAGAPELADFAKMEQIRARVDEIVDDPATAEALKPWYGYFCKRPCFHDDYLQSFNRANVELVDTRGLGVERITETGVVVDGVEHPLDCLIFATGFEVGTDYCRRAGFEVIGRDGVTLTDTWRDGVHTLHGMHVRGFPNCFVLSIAQSGFTVNFPYLLDVQATHVAWLMAWALANDVDAIGGVGRRRGGVGRHRHAAIHGQHRPGQVVHARVLQPRGRVRREDAAGKLLLRWANRIRRDLAGVARRRRLPGPRDPQGEPRGSS